MIFRQPVLLIFTTFIVISDVQNLDIGGEIQHSDSVIKNIDKHISSTEAQKKYIEEGNFNSANLENVTYEYKDTSAVKSINTYLKTKSKHRKYRTRKSYAKKIRCKRYDLENYQLYQQIPAYAPNYDGKFIMSPNYIPPQYLIPPAYIPSKCLTYCAPCPTSSCRRRCPDTFLDSGFSRPVGARKTSKATLGTTKSCNCDPDGSRFLTCTAKTGECVCKPFFTGKNCSICKDGYWKQNKNCVKCACNEQGTEDPKTCNKQTGICHCKIGVAGEHCDLCLPQHYGSVQTGCTKCDPCDKKGHICDPKNGKCVCPPNSEGSECQICSENAWGHEPGIGCRACSCSKTGSSSLQCHKATGICTCNIGFEGENCEQCSFGYYGYPDCRRCSCDLRGTKEEDCHNDLCRCTENGSCRCKENVEGKNCKRCIKNYYGLKKENTEGCTSCFCFNRSDSCVDALLRWDKIRMETNGEDNNEVAEDELMLPKKFLGDLTTSYGGHLNVKVTGGYFHVFIEGSGVKLHSVSSSEFLHMTELSNWTINFLGATFPKNCSIHISRACFMVVLQNVSSIVVKANNRIKEVLLDQAKADIPNTYTVTHSIEKCRCPKEYTGLSCQDPNEGYYRYFPQDPRESWIDQVIGKAKLCECRGWSKQCDATTGYCKNCSNHTIGNHCELCDVGYYKNIDGSCSACRCPSITQNNAESCSSSKSGLICRCKKGYKGNLCDQCDKNYFGKDLYPGFVICEPCDCNPDGVFSENCNVQGKCSCKPGFKGKKCNECVKEREFIENGKCTPCTNCTQLLLTEIGKLTLVVENTFKLLQKGLGPPWKKLGEEMEKHNLLSEKFRDRKIKAEHLETKNIKQYEKKVPSMEAKLNKNSVLAEMNVADINSLHENSEKLSKESKNLSEKLKVAIQNLNISDKKQDDLEKALVAAEKIHREVKLIFTKIQQLNDDETLALCSSVIKKVDGIYDPPSIPLEKLNEIKKQLQNLIDITAYIDNKSELAENKNLQNSKRIFQLKEKIKNMESEHETLDNIVGQIISKINGINDVMICLETVLLDLKNISRYIEYKNLEDRVKRQSEDIPEIDSLYLRAIEHVQELENNISSYRSMFNFTKDEWMKINASGAYQAIISGISDAKEVMKTSQNILHNVTKIISPDDSDQLVDKTNLVYTYSDRLKQRISNLKNISKNLIKIKKKLNELKYSILANGKSNNDLTQILHMMEMDINSQSDIVSKLEEVISNSSSLSEEMRDIENQFKNLQFDNTSNFTKDYKVYFNLTTYEEINNMKRNLKYINGKLQEVNISSLDTPKSSDNKLQSIQKTLNELKNKMEYAKQAADVIFVPMNLSNCAMTYEVPTTEPFHFLSITYKCRTCDLLKWSSENKTVLAVRVVNNTNKIEIGNQSVSIGDEINKQNTIMLHKTGSILKIQLGSSEQRVMMNTYTLSSKDLIQIGDAKNLVTDGYVSKVVLNDRNFGVWKFTSTNGNCTGQKGDFADEPPDVLTYFSGRGYRRYGPDISFNPTKLTLSFQFTTFDENSLIYLAKNKNCSYIALYLKDGHIHFTVSQKSVRKCNLISKLKYNTGQKHRVEITMKYINKIQYYTVYVEKERLENETKLNKTEVFKIKEAEHYIGGVPSTFDSYNCHLDVTTSFLGFLEQSSKLTNETMSYGVFKVREKILEFSHAWINKNGYLEMKWLDEKIITIYFILRATLPDGIIMRFNKNDKLYISNYKLFLNNDYYNITLKGTGYDSVNISVGNFKIKEADLMGKENRIIFGDTNDSFNGVISNIWINNKLLSFNHSHVINFSNVDIGREKKFDTSSNKISVRSLAVSNFTNSMQNTESCSAVAEYSTDPDAVKFGDKPNSYVYIKNKFWQRDYTLQLQFRTFYPNGVIFISRNQKQHHIILELKKGKLIFTIKGKRKKTRQIRPNKKINDGQWHTINFTKKKRKLLIVFDGIMEKPMNMRVKMKDEIYLGGVSSSMDYPSIISQIGELNQFRGCIRSFFINGEHKLLIGNNKDIMHSNIGQCFSQIEDGAYFGGDAFAVYKDFQVSQILELSLEFRTGEQNGILLSISNHGNYPALSIELQNGAVVMTVDMGNGIVSNVKNNFGSDFALCNNKWHNVTAMYSSSELTINVDGIRKSWVQSDVNSTMDEIEAPLYIGGTPDNVPVRTFRSRENFKGCIRKLKIEDKLMNWSDTQYLKNVLLHSCPVL